MPEYTSTLLLVFILASCFYKKHIKNWTLFTYGLYAYVAGIAIAAFGGLLELVIPLGGYELATMTNALSMLATLAGGVAFVLACLKDARQDVEHLHCLKCGYILKGLSEPRCPECGQTI